MPPTTPVPPTPPPTPPNSPVMPGPPRSSAMSHAAPLFRDRYVRIVNTVTGKGLLAGSWGTKAGDPNVWQYPLTNTGLNSHGFEWILFPTSDGSYLIVNRVSGSALVAGNYGVGDDRHVWQYPLNTLGSHSPDAFKWGFVKDGAAYRIINRASGYALLCGNWGATDEDLMWQWPLSETGSNDKAFLWTLDPTDHLEVPVLRPGEDDGVQPPDIPRLTSMSDTPPTVSESWVVAEVLVPFMYVTDAAVSYQLMTTPYYILSREQYWDRSKIAEYDGQTGNTFTQEITTGISETSSRSLENELKITIAADASFSYGGASVALKTELQNTLKISESTSQSQTHEEKKSVKITLPNVRCRVLTWQLVESFTLLRGDRGSTVGQASKAYLDGNVISDIWTEKGAAPLVHSTPAETGQPV